MFRPHLVRAFAVVLLLASGRGMAAQTIAGRVVDVAGRTPTRLLPVIVLGDSGRVVARTRTDTAGVFYALLLAGGRFRLRFALDSTTTFDSDTIRVGDDEFVQREFVVPLPRAFLEFEVEKQVAQVRGIPGPRYPSAMRAQNIEGKVVAQFVVDSAGLPRLETFRVLRSTDPAFTGAVRTWLLRARFLPAELHGRHVPQMVQQPFTFALTDGFDARADDPFRPPTPRPRYSP